MATSALKVDDIRADVLAEIHPYADRPELAVIDPSFVDPPIAEAIKQGGGDRAWVVRNAQMKLGNKLRSDEGFAAIEKLVAERYAHPVITKNGDRVTIDAGVLPGKLHVFKSKLEIDTSPLLDRGEWATPEVVKALQAGIAQYPDAPYYDAVVLIPAYSKRPDWKYAYDRQAGTVRITMGNDYRTPVYIYENTGDNLSRVTSLHTTGLKVDRRNISSGRSGG